MKKFDFQPDVESFADRLLKELQTALEKEADKMEEEYIAKFRDQIGKLKAELAMKAGSWIMQQCVMIPTHFGYEVRIFVNTKGEKDGGNEAQSVCRHGGRS